MRNPKQLVKVMHYVNGELTRVREERRVVYTCKNGGRYIRGMQGKKSLKLMRDGTPFYETFVRRIRAHTLSDILGAI